MKIEAFLDYEAVLANQAQLVHLALRFTADEISSDRTKPIALALVLDRSGSMDGKPLKYAKKAAELVVRNLRRDDHLSLTVFDSSAQMLWPLQPVSSPQALRRIIKEIQTGGSTNLTAGWCLGRDTLCNAPVDMPRRLLLLSDGQLNRGIIDPDAVRTVAKLGLEKNRVRTSCLGFGDFYNEDLLSDLAKLTNGTFYDANDAESLPTIFSAELDGLQKIATQNLRIRVERLTFCDAVVLLSDYVTLPLPDKNTIEINVGDLVSNEERTLVMALDVPPLPSVEGTPVASLEGEELLKIEILWDAITPTGIETHSHKQVIRVLPVQKAEDIRTNKEVITWVNIQRAGKVVEDAILDFDAGRHDLARERILDELNRLDASPDTDAADSVSLLRSTLERMKNPSDYNTLRGRKSDRFRSQSYRRMSSHAMWTADEPPPSFKMGTPPVERGTAPEDEGRS